MDARRYRDGVGALKWWHVAVMLICLIAVAGVVVALVKATRRR